MADVCDDVPTKPKVAPSAPTIGTVTPGDGSASVAFTPGEAGSATVSEFKVTCTPASGSAVTATGSSSPISVTGLTNGTQYSCSVTATSSAGTSAASASANVTPAALPSAPV